MGGETARCFRVSAARMRKRNSLTGAERPIRCDHGQGRRRPQHGEPISRSRTMLLLPTSSALVKIPHLSECIVSFSVDFFSPFPFAVCDSLNPPRMMEVVAEASSVRPPSGAAAEVTCNGRWRMKKAADGSLKPTSKAKVVLPPARGEIFIKKHTIQSRLSLSDIHSSNYCKR